MAQRMKHAHLKPSMFQICGMMFGTQGNVIINNYNELHPGEISVNVVILEDRRLRH